MKLLLVIVLLFTATIITNCALTNRLKRDLQKENMIKRIDDDFHYYGNLCVKCNFKYKKLDYTDDQIQVLCRDVCIGSHGIPILYSSLNKRTPNFYGNKCRQCKYEQRLLGKSEEEVIRSCEVPCAPYQIPDLIFHEVDDRSIVGDESSNDQRAPNFYGNKCRQCKYEQRLLGKNEEAVVRLCEVPCAPYQIPELIFHEVDE